MRYYLLDAEKGEHVIDLTKTKVHSADMVEFDFSLKVGCELKEKETIFIRQLIGSYFVSTDGISWRKIPRQNLPGKILNVNQNLDLYRGFKPSGISTSEEGDLITQMPGVVVKIPVKPGQDIKKGETLIILEAMKMENEIKSSMDGKIKEIHVKEGESLEQGKLMMELETP